MSTDLREDTFKAWVVLDLLNAKVLWMSICTEEQTI